MRFPLLFDALDLCFKRQNEKINSICEITSLSFIYISFKLQMSSLTKVYNFTVSLSEPWEKNKYMNRFHHGHLRRRLVFT